MEKDTEKNKDADENKAKISQVTKISIYTVTVTFICLIIFGYVLSDGPPFNLIYQQKAEQSTDLKPFQDGTHRLGVFLRVLSAGAIGGCLYNFRGIKKHLAQDNWESRYFHSYLLRPLSAAVCGLFVFVLFMSGVLVLTVGKADIHTHDVESILLFVALSILAGYSSHEFLKKVKDIMKTVFSLSELEHEDEKRRDNSGEPKKDIVSGSKAENKD